MERPDDPRPPPESDPAAAHLLPGLRIPPDPARCELCGFEMRVERHCKIVCPNCGFTRDCSDP